MKGTLKSLEEKFHPHKRTNFNDWSDPKESILKDTLDPVKKEDISEESSNKSLHKDSFISRTSVEIELLRKKIKDGYPLLSQKEIRQHRLPFHESLIINLKEDGFVATSEFIRDLITLDEELHGLEDVESYVKSRPLLKESVPILKILSEKLVKAEVAKLEGNTIGETKALLSCAIQFTKPDKVSWFWLAEELYEQSIIVGEDEVSCSKVDNETKAIAKYLFAAFLLDFINDAERSRKLVEESMELSIGKFWNASEITGQQSDILYLESCLLLHRVFLQLANKLLASDMEEAIKLCRSSLHWAKQINHKYAEAKALISLAMIYLAAKQYSPILSNVETYMKLCTELEDYEGLCEGHILMAQYHEQLNDDDLLLDDLKNLLSVAKDKKLLKMKALAYGKLASYYMVHEEEKEMQRAAIKAYKYCGQLNNVKDLDNARCLVGIAQAHEIMPHYLSLLLDAEHLNTTEFEHLMLWKNLRIPFFSNVKLFQPEADDNFELRERIEHLRSDEFQTVNEAKHAELSSKASSHSTLRHIMSIQSSAPKMSMGVQYFHNQLRSAMLTSEPSLKLASDSSFKFSTSQFKDSK